jgi:hypothetical protein
MQLNLYDLGGPCLYFHLHNSVSPPPPPQYFFYFFSPKDGPTAPFMRFFFVNKEQYNATFVHEKKKNQIYNDGM